MYALTKKKKSAGRIITVSNIFLALSSLLQKEYKDLAEQLSEYTVKLLDRVRTQPELEIILNKAGKPRFNQYESLARFKLALFYKEKKVRS